MPRYVKNGPIGLNGGLNRYGYVGKSPLMHGSPFGRWSIGGKLSVEAVRYFNV